MMLVSILLLSLCFHPNLSYYSRKCSREEHCLPVPASVCDNSKCVPFKVEDFNEFAKGGVKRYTWNIARTPINGYCPIMFHFECDGKAITSGQYIINSEPLCNDSAPATDDFYGELDSYTGEVTTIKSKIDGEEYVSCLLYFERGAAVVFRKCRARPLKNGESCAAIHAAETVFGNYNRSKLLDFLKASGIDFPQVNVDCF